MTSLVIDLQKDSINKEVNISELLRKAIILSSKLGTTEIEAWINKELSGYSENEIVPDYRKIKGVYKVKNPYHGLQSLHFENTEVGEILSQIEIYQSILELDSILDRCGSSNLQIKINENKKKILMNGMTNTSLEPVLIVGYSQIYKITEIIRNKILNWALSLEKKGILGEGLNFSIHEKNEATKIINQTINHFGNIENSQFQQNTSKSTQTKNIKLNVIEVSNFTEKLKESLSVLELDNNSAKELKYEILTLESQLSSPKPKSVIVNESLKSIRSILEGIAGSVVAAGLLYILSGLL